MVQQSLKNPERIYVYVNRFHCKSTARVTKVNNGKFTSFGVKRQIKEVDDFLIRFLGNIGHKNCQIVGDGIREELLSDIISLSVEMKLDFKPIICTSL